MNIEVKLDYEKALKEFNKSAKRLEELIRRKVVIKIDEDKVYDETGIKVERIAFYMEYGKDELNVHYPARPFWRNTLIKYEKRMCNLFDSQMQPLLDGKISVYQFYEKLGKQFKEYLIAVIKEGNFIPLDEKTIKMKEKKMSESPSSPLIDSRTLINSIIYEVI